MATKANLIIDQGTSFSTTLTITDVDGDVLDLTGYTGAAQMRKHYTSHTYYTFEVSVTPGNGEVTLAMNANTTNLIPSGRYVYDCELTDTGGLVSRVLEGIVTVTPGVTR